MRNSLSPRQVRRGSFLSAFATDRNAGRTVLVPLGGIIGFDFSLASTTEARIIQISIFQRSATLQCTVVLSVLVIVTAPGSLLGAADYAVANGAIPASQVADPLIVVGAGWFASIQAPPAFFWGINPAFDTEGAFTFTSTGTTLLNVTDDFCPGDQFRIYDFSVAIGDTPPVAISYSCPELGPAAASVTSTDRHRTFVLRPGNHSITIQTITTPFGGGRGYLRVDPFNGSVDLLDPVSQLIGPSGTAVLSDPSDPRFNLPTLITRSGVAADGAAELVIRFNAPQSGSVSFSLVDVSGNTLPPGQDYGLLTDLIGNPINSAITIPTVTNGSVRAFALYTAPNHFARVAHPEDLTAASRYVYLQATFSAGGSTYSLPPVPVTVVRPPIALVHGIWSDESAWNSFPLPSSTACTDSVTHYACRIDYKDYNSLHFAVIAPYVGSRIRDRLANFRATRNVAALQMDVIAHSMGGNVIRTLPLCGTVFKDCVFTYRIPTNMGKGDIHQLLTIGTPHLGSPLANDLIANLSTKCCWHSFCQGNLQSQFDDRMLPIGNGAVDDLQQNGGAINGLNSVASLFPMYFYVGVASSADETLISSKQGLIQAVNNCAANILPSTPQGIFGSSSDLIVSTSSQRKGLAAGHTGTTDSSSSVGNTIHTAAININSQSGYSQDELTFTTLGNDVLQLLDTGTFIIP